MWDLGLGPSAERRRKPAFCRHNNSAEIVAIDPHELRELTRVRTDGYAVGLDVAPDGRQVWVTSQGRSGQGGNSICVFSVERIEKEEP